MSAQRGGLMGLWIRWARHLLKLPEGDPKIPGDAAKLRSWNPSEGYLRYRMLGFWILAVPLIALAAGLILGAIPLAVILHDEIRLVGAAALALGLMALGLFLLALLAFQAAAIHLELDMLRYTLSADAVRLRRGVGKVEEVTFSYVNIQNVKYSQGPIQRHFGIADLFVETAGGGGGAPPPGQAGLGHRGRIQGVSDPEELRECILERVRRVRGAGLGDAAEGSPRGGLDDAAALEALGEIRAFLSEWNRELAGPVLPPEDRVA